MRFNILADFHCEAKIDYVINEISDLGFRQYFEERDYGPGLDGVTVVLMCQEPDLK